MKATEQYFHVVLFIMLYKVDLTFDAVDERYYAVVSCGIVYAVDAPGLMLFKVVLSIFLRLWMKP